MADPLKKVKKSNVQQEVLLQIEKQIYQGSWKPGRKIPAETDLAASLGVSRISVRGAIQRLIAQGLLESRHGDGTYVQQDGAGNSFGQLKPFLYLGEPDLLSLIQYRRIVETGICDLVIVNITEKEIEELEKHVEGMRANLGNLQEYVKEDVEFHYTFVRSSRNPFIMKIFEIIKGIYLHGIEEIVQSIGPDDGIVFHGRILDALRSRDITSVRNAVFEHLSSTEKRMREKAGHGR